MSPFPKQKNLKKLLKPSHAMNYSKEAEGTELRNIILAQL